MAAIEFKVSCEGTEDILFKYTDNQIKTMDFKMNTINENNLTRDQNIRPEFKLTGVLDLDNKKETNKLAAWAVSKDEGNIYRTIEIKVTSSDDESSTVLRYYKFDKMFVMDYDEIFKSDNDDDQEVGSFVLFIAQAKKGSEKIIKCE